MIFLRGGRSLGLPGAPHVLHWLGTPPGAARPPGQLATLHKHPVADDKACDVRPARCRAACAATPYVSAPASATSTHSPRVAPQRQHVPLFELVRAGVECGFNPAG